MNKLLIFFLFLFSIMSAFSAKPPAGSDLSANTIQVPGGDSAQLNLFFEKLHKTLATGSGQVNILHLGSSHVQAGFFSNRIRCDLEAINDKYRNTRGFTFPYPVAKTNNPTDYKVSYKGKWESERNVQRNKILPLGVAGIAVVTEDPSAEITIDFGTNEYGRGRPFDRLLLIGNSPDGDEYVLPILKIDELTYLRGDYDALRHVYQYILPENSEQFTVQFLQSDDKPHRFILNGFIPENNAAGAVYHAIGVNGSLLSSWLECDNFETELQLIKPDLVIFGIGINDASGRTLSESDFMYKYNSLIERIKRVSPDCAVIFITNNDSYRRVSRRRTTLNRNGVTARKAFFKLAEENRAGVWDLFQVMGGLNSIQKWVKAGLAKRDKVHFTSEGYYLLGDLFSEAMINYYRQYNIEK